MRHSLFLPSARKMQMNKLGSVGEEWKICPGRSHGKITLNTSTSERRAEEKRVGDGRGEERRGKKQHLETTRHHSTAMVNLFPRRRGKKRRKICFLSSSILSVFVQTSCMSSSSCLLPVLTDGCFSLKLLSSGLLSLTLSPCHWVKVLEEKQTWVMDLWTTEKLLVMPSADHNRV